MNTQQSNRLHVANTSLSPLLRQKPVIEFGDTGENVRAVQGELKKLGFFNRDITGNFGNITQDAVIRFQQLNPPLLPDGRVGKNTWNALITSAPQSVLNNRSHLPPATSISRVANTSLPPLLRQKPVIEFGDTGENVRTVQRELKRLGFFNRDITGNFGKITQNAVIRFQQLNPPLSPDGRVDKNTLNALNTSAPQSVLNNRSHLPPATSVSRSDNTANRVTVSTRDQISSRDRIIQQYTGQRPQATTKKGLENRPIEGLVTGFDSKGRRSVILTLDFCETGFDRKLIDSLITKKIPATLFLAGPWIDSHPNELKILMNAKRTDGRTPLFDLQSHGNEHKPLFSSPVPAKELYKTRSGRLIRGSESPEGVYREIQTNAERMHRVTGVWPGFIRPATCGTDTTAIRIAKDLGERVVNFRVNADEGGTANTQRVQTNIARSHPGDIILAHGNKHSANGVIAGIEALQARGFSFTTLNEQADRLR